MKKVIKREAVLFTTWTLTGVDIGQANTGDDHCNGEKQNVDFEGEENRQQGEDDKIGSGACTQQRFLSTIAGELANYLLLQSIVLNISLELLYRFNYISIP
jgi:hypothetical protein